jgi:hypothetical protein
MDNSNYNESVTVRVLSRNELYIGRYVQSFGNTTFIYKIVAISNDKLELESAYRMWNGVFELDTEYENTQYLYDFNRLCETVHTQELNIDTIRDNKLNLLGI